MLLISKATYPNVLDAVRYHYAKKGETEDKRPIEILLNINKVYLERLEEFLRDEVDLPGFYAFVEGRGGTFEKEVGYPLCRNALTYLIGTLEGENENEHGPRCTAEITLPASGGTIPIDSTKLIGECFF